LNAVIRAIVKTAIFRYGLEVVGFIDGYSGVIHNKLRTLESKDASGILPRGGTILGTSNRDDPFRFPVVVKGQKGFRDVSDQAVRNIGKNKVDVLFVLGGDGSLTIGSKLSKKGVKLIGVPKTIDNDLWGTDVTFGFDTALQVAMGAIDRLHSTAESHHRIMVVEVMGRYAGWIALMAGLAGGGDVILIPEIPFEYGKVCQQILDRRKQGKRFSIVVVAEGAKPKKGEMVVQRVIEDSTDPLRLGGIGYKVGKPGSPYWAMCKEEGARRPSTASWPPVLERGRWSWPWKESLGEWCACGGPRLKIFPWKKSAAGREG
jgi:6-phosphofructokinase 1